MFIIWATAAASLRAAAFSTARQTTKGHVMESSTVQSGEPVRNASNRRNVGARIGAITVALAVIAAAVITVGIVAQPPAAQAAVGVVTCASATYTLNFTHPTTGDPFGPVFGSNRTFNVSGTATAKGCGSLTHPAINGTATTAISPGGQSSTGSCSNGGTLHATGVITWANGDATTIVATAIITAFPIPTALITGDFTQGLFSGPLTTGTSLFPTFAFNPVTCAPFPATTPGMTTVTGTIGLSTILSPV